MKTEIGTQLGAPTADGRSVIGLPQTEPAFEENKSRIAPTELECKDLSMLHTDKSQSPEREKHGIKFDPHSRVPYRDNEQAGVRRIDAGVPPGLDSSVRSDGRFEFALEEDSKGELDLQDGEDSPRGNAWMRHARNINNPGMGMGMAVLEEVDKAEDDESQFEQNSGVGRNSNINDEYFENNLQ